jgi:hypothetical protein
MSSCITKAGEDDMRTELKVLDKLNEDIDQLSSDARDCTTLAPAVKDALDLAWYFAEEALRDAGRSSCGQLAKPETGFCPCCRHFEGSRTEDEQVCSFRDFDYSLAQRYQSGLKFLSSSTACRAGQSGNFAPFLGSQILVALFRPQLSQGHRGSILLFSHTHSLALRICFCKGVDNSLALSYYTSRRWS